MINGLAMWHYPHREWTDTIRFFGERGLQSLSLLGEYFVELIDTRSLGDELADELREYNFVVTMHHCLPKSHSDEDVERFRHEIEVISAWQNKNGLISILSFDVPQDIRDNAGDYIDYALDNVDGVRVAVEDFGLNESERVQLEHLKGNDRFGLLIDVGHMNLRLYGKNTMGVTLFTNSQDECPATDNPTYDDFMRAFNYVEFPIFEIHLHNNDGVDDLHYFLEDGVLDIEMIARVIKDIGFDGVLTIESAPGFRFECYGEEADTGILKTFEYWKKCSAK